MYHNQSVQVVYYNGRISYRKITPAGAAAWVTQHFGFLKSTSKRPSYVISYNGLDHRCVFSSIAVW